MVSHLSHDETVAKVGHPLNLAPRTKNPSEENLVGMPVVCVFLGGAGHFFKGHNASFEFAAADVLELDGGVGDLEVLLENMVELFQDAGAFRGWNVGDAHMAGEGAGLRAEAPDVKVVDVNDPLNGFHAGADLGQGAAARGAFEKNIEGFANDAHA